jgi:N-acetylneuraminic acid mutarotase
MIVWGGEIGNINAPQMTDDGAAYDPARRTWRALAPSPLPARAGAITVWTGSEVLIWGGSTVEGPLGTQPVSGAVPPAAYNPRTDTWRKFPAGPLAGASNATGAWTGSELMIFGRPPPRPPGRSPRSRGAGGEMVGAAFSPCTNRWRRIASAPIEPRGAVTPVWTGSEVLVWGGNADNNVPIVDGAAYNPDRDTWRRLPPVSVRGYYAPNAVWTGTEMLVWGWSNLVEDRSAQNETVAYNPETNTWRSLPRAPLLPPRDQDGGTLGELVAWTGESLLAWSGGLDAEGPLVLQFDPLSQRWTRLPRAPAAFPYSPAVVWTGHELIVLGVGPGLRALALGFAAR